jgi:predicted acylesterase/phospholipase RssA
MVKLYEDHGAEIFRKSRWRTTLSWIHGATYSPGALEALLNQYTGETRLSEALTGLLIPSWELRTRTAWFFRRAQARTNPEFDYQLSTIARATSAAPTYFPPQRLASPDGSPDYALVDGGVFANNPAMAAWVDSHEGARPDQDVFVVSLGTGSVDDPITESQGRRWGKVSWAQPVIGVLMDGGTDTVEYELGSLLNRDQYYRFQTDIPVPNRKLDDASPANLAALRKVAETMMDKRAADLTAICERLRQLA